MDVPSVFFPSRMWKGLQRLPSMPLYPTCFSNRRDIFLNVDWHSYSEYLPDQETISSSGILSVFSDCNRDPRAKSGKFQIRISCCRVSATLYKGVNSLVEYQASFASSRTHALTANREYPRGSFKAPSILPPSSTTTFLPTAAVPPHLSSSFFLLSLGVQHLLPVGGRPDGSTSSLPFTLTFLLPFYALLRSIFFHADGFAFRSFSINIGTCLVFQKKRKKN